MAYPNRTRRAQALDGVEYAPGKKFRVIRDGAYLTGMKPAGPSALTGWRQDLSVGDVIECTGFGAGWGSDPGFGVEWTSDRAKAEHASGIEFKPSGGHWCWSYHPADGYLEPEEDA